MTRQPPGRRYVVVSFHAHPDDEALYTGGTLAKAAADGHRVVVVVATAGESGLAAEQPGDVPLGTRRTRELTASADVLGCARVVLLGYADSGLHETASPPAPTAFAAVDVETAAQRLAEVLVEESADVLTTYDAAGGYGHPDHRQVHKVGARAAEIAGTRVVVEATVDRDTLRPLMRLLRAVSRLLPGLYLPPVDTSYTARADITHRIDVRDVVDLKRAAMAAHASQATAPSGIRTLALALRLPGPVFRRVFGREWFVERGRTPTGPPLESIFATLEGERNSCI